MSDFNDILCDMRQDDLQNLAKQEANLVLRDFFKLQNKCLQYESFIQEITKQTVHHRDGDKPTKLAVRAKKLLEENK